MNILALETSTEWCSVALWQQQACLVRESRAGQSHSGLVLQMVDALLLESGISLKALDGIAYGAGPGAFTGLRIACAVAQGLAFAHDLPVTGVGTLRALAAADAMAKVFCCLDARMNEVYCGQYARAGEEWLEVSAPQVCAPGAVPLPRDTGWCGRGSGFAAYGDILRERLDGTLETVAPSCFPHAREVAMLAAPVFAAGRGEAAESAMPLYVRNRVALKTAER